MSETQLSVNQLNQIKIDLGEGKEFLKDEEVLVLAQNVKKLLSIHIPFLSEEKELIVLFKIIRLIDRKLYDLLPNEYYELIRDIANGISEEEATELQKRLVQIINKSINIPVLPESVEETIIDFVLGLIIKAMVKGVNLTQEIAKA